MIRIILCDDHAVVRRGIRDTLCEADDIEVVAEAASYSEVREALRKHPCDVLVLDLNLPGRGGLEVLGTLRESNAGSDTPVRVLVVSMFPEDQYAIRCLKAGAQGYLNKAGDPGELITAVRTVMQGKKYVTPAVSQMLVDNLHAPTNELLHATLSEREMQTLLKIASSSIHPSGARPSASSPPTCKQTS